MQAKERAEKMTAREWNALRDRVLANDASKWDREVYRAGWKLYGAYARKM